MTPTTDETAFLRTIREYPEADLPRLVFADWYEENGQAERAELIRLQCDPLYVVPCGQVAFPLEDYPDLGVECLDYMDGSEEPAESWCPQCKARHRVLRLLIAHDTDTEKHVPYPFTGNGWTSYAVHQYDRGLIREVRAPLAWLLGGECECVRRWELHRVPPGETIVGGCYACHGSVRTPGHLPGLCEKWPIERVVVTDREPMPDTMPSAGAFLWWQASGGNVHPESDLPDDVFRRLPGGTVLTSISRLYTTRTAALAALSAAVLPLAKKGAKT